MLYLSNCFLFWPKVENYIYKCKINRTLQINRVRMSDKQEESQQIQWNEEQLDKFFQYQQGDWMPYNSSQVYLSIQEYNMLFNTLDQKQPLSINPKVFSNRFHFKERQYQHQNSKLDLQNEQRFNQNLDNQKIRIAKKIQSMLARRNANTTNPFLSSKRTPTHIPQDFKQQSIHRSEINGRNKRKRAVVTKQILDKVKKYFRIYNDCEDKPLSQRISFRDIAGNLGVSLAEIARLYQEYSQDPLFSDRMKKLESDTKQTLVKSSK